MNSFLIYFPIILWFSIGNRQQNMSDKFSDNSFSFIFYLFAKGCFFCNRYCFWKVKVLTTKRIKTSSMWHKGIVEIISSLSKKFRKRKEMYLITIECICVVFAFVVHNCCYFHKVRVSSSALKTIGKYNAHELLDLIGLK